MNTIAVGSSPFKIFGFELSQNVRAFINWALVWIFLANACFMTMWLFGAPPRKAEILIAGLMGILVRGRPFWVQYSAFCASIMYSTLTFIAGLFNLKLLSLLFSLQFLLELKPSSSLEYIIAGGAIIVTLAAAFFILRRVETNFTGVKLMLTGCILLFSLINIDTAMGEGMRGHYGRQAEDGAYFESASQKSDFYARADGKRNLVLVIVESLGAPHNNPEITRKLFGLYKHPKVTDIYDIETGTSLYYNSTTKGEIRELCGRWGDYHDLLDAKDNSCQPAKLVKKGYITKSMHSFDGDFFERKIWYPNIGFQSQQFSPEIAQRGAQACGGVFPGVCDRDVPRLITEELKKTDEPQFIYWLTVNAHLPVPPGSNLDVDNCERISPKLAKDFPMICRQFAIFDSTDTALIKEITAEDFPDSDILIVGDHMPPYFDRYYRSQFDPEHVPYIYLKHKSPADAKGQMQIAAQIAIE